MTPLRTLNELGSEKFLAWLEKPIGPAPKSILFDPEYSDVLAASFTIDPDQRFSTSFELGRYLFNDVFLRSDDRFAIRSLNDTWAWISLLYIDSLLTRRGKAAPRPLAPPHYMDGGARLSYRLIARTAWELYLLHGDNCAVALSSRVSPWGEMSEQMTGASQENFSHKTFWSLANQLYLDADGNIKKGAASRRPKAARLDPKIISGKGGARRLAMTMKQFERTYNTREIDVTELVAVLPSEFKKWQRDL